MNHPAGYVTRIEKLLVDESKPKRGYNSYAVDGMSRQNRLLAFYAFWRLPMASTNGGVLYPSNSGTPVAGQPQTLALDAAGNLKVNVVVGGGGGGGSNAAAGPTGSAVPTYADYLGFSNAGGTLVGVSAANPIPITGSISATNPSVGTDNTTAPTSSTQIGFSNSGGTLVAASPSNPVPVTSQGAGSTGAAIPSSAILNGFSNASGTLVGVSSSNGFPVTNLAGTANIGTVSLASGSSVALSAGTSSIGTVSVSGTPTVNFGSSANVTLATGSNTVGTVSIGGTPTVNLGSSSSVTLATGSNTVGTVSIGGTASVLDSSYVTQGSTSGTATIGPTVMANVVNTGTGYTTGTVEPMTLNGSGNLRVSLANVNANACAFAAPSATAGTAFSPLVIGAYNSTAYTLTTGQTAPLAITANAALITSDTNLVTFASTTGTSGVGPLMMANCLTGVPNYTTGNTYPLTIANTGGIRVNLTQTSGNPSALVNPTSQTVTVAPVAIGSFNTTPLVITSGNCGPIALNSSAAIYTDTEITKSSYATSFTITPAATPTDVFTITGSSSRTIRVKRVHITSNATTLGAMTLQLLERSSANTGGTSTNPTKVPLDNNNIAGTGTVTAYTANPSALGTLIGAIDTAFLSFGVNAVSPPYDRSFGNAVGTQSIVLRGSSQSLAVNLGGGTVPSGGALCIGVEWTESVD